MADTLDSLAIEIRRCKKCPLHRSRKRAVPGIGPSSAKVFFIGEAPGEEEDVRGLPFIGRAGKMMGKLVSDDAQLPREILFLTNTVRCHPPHNRDPFVDEVAACSDWTKKQLDVIQPTLVVTLGRFAADPYFHGLPMGEIHSCLTRKDGQLIFAAYHPAASLHQPGLRSALSQDFRLIGEVVRYLA